METLIYPQTFEFLAAIKENNDREWFQANRDAYERAWQNMKDFTTAVIAGLAQTDRYISEDISVSKCLFRIYRDTRFSKDKTPYKTWFGAGISTAGRKLNGPEYYLHIQPGNSFAAGGYWRPEKDHLSAIRQEIDYNGEQLVKLLDKPDFKHHCQLDSQDKLKRPPAGFDEQHPHIDLLKLKSFTASEILTEKELSGPEALDRVLQAFRRMYDFKLFLHQALGDE
jgi:TIGR02453 family protein